jgi:hypothetical protein
VRYQVWYLETPNRLVRPELVYDGTCERDARRAAARALGSKNLRGLAQSLTEDGIIYYAPGADDYNGSNVTIIYS